MPYLSAVRTLRPGALGQAYSVAGHIADNFRDFEEVSDVSGVQKAMLLPGATVQCVPGRACRRGLSGVDRADEYSLGLCELADRCDAFGGRDRVVLTDKVAAVVLRSAEWPDYWRTRTAGAGTGC